MNKKKLTVMILTALTLTSTSVFAEKSNQYIETIRLSETTEKNTTEQDIKQNDAIVVEVETCNPYDRLTTEEVKMIDDNLFLDKNGNKVNPCSHEGFVYFKKIGLYENGKKLFKNSTNAILNRQSTNDAISLNFDKPYTISYGNKELNIKDMNDFRKSANQAALQGDKGLPSNDYSVNSQIVQSKFTEKELEDTFTFLAIPANTPLPEQFMNTPEAEKQKAISEMYNTLKTKFQEIETRSKTVADNFTLNDMLTYNRLIINDNHVVSQYLVPNEQDKKTEVNGASFYLFTKYRNINTFVKMVEALVDEYSTAPNIKTDDRLIFLNYILEKGGTEIPQKAEEYGALKAKEWHDNIKDMSLLNKQGIAIYDQSSEEDIRRYSELAVKANQLIQNNEYTILPDQLTGGQYKALSNIDKYKYAPVRNKHWTDKNNYVKVPWEQVVSTVIEK